MNARWMASTAVAGLPAARNLLFLEGRYTVSDVSQASVGFGATFR